MRNNGRNSQRTNERKSNFQLKEQSADAAAEKFLHVAVVEKTIYF
jgi:hypothetical protein